MKLKKILALALAALLLGLLAVPAFAATTIDTVEIRVSGRAGGYTYADVEKFVKIRTPGVSIAMADLIPGEGKDAYTGELKVGDTYLLSLKLTADSGYAFSAGVTVDCNLADAKTIRGSDSALYVLVPFAVTGNGGGFLSALLGFLQNFFRALMSIFSKLPLGA
ncbi:MAG: hypothetical protein IKD72_02280 [Clostridia bacterium]|nr:hypothetical protein [Clostridia bacterium]